jgi:hypothetical protein
MAVSEAGASSPGMMRIVVDLPAPFGPGKPVTRPGWTVKLRSSSAVTGLNSLVTRLSSGHGSCADPGGAGRAWPTRPTLRYAMPPDGIWATQISAHAHFGR